MMNNLRATMMTEEDLIASKRRFALFSQPAPLAIGDDSLFKQKKRTRGQNGKPITKPPQMLSGPCRSGQTKSAYFQVPQSILQGDPYKQRFKQDLQYEKKMHTKSNYHENQFKPASQYKTLASSSYQYKPQNPQTKRKIIKDQTGKVQTQPRNFTTNPMFKVQTDFFKTLKHMPDPYNRQRQMQKKQRQIFNSKLPKDVPPFKSTVFGNKPLVKDQITYGLDDKMKQIIAKKKQRAKTVVNVFNHQTAFVPAMRYPGETINKFPQHMSNRSVSQIEKKIISKHKQEGKQKWKPNNWGLTRPTPSITLHPKNIRFNRYR